MKTSFLAALLVISVPGMAEADELDLSVGSAVRWTHTHSADALSADDSFPFFSFNAGLQLDRLALRGFDVIVDAAVERGVMSGTTFRRLRSDVSLWSFQGGARARRRVLSRLSLFGRAALGLQRAVVKLDDDFSGGRPMRDKGWVGTFYAGAGTELALFKSPPRSDKRTISLGIRFELGYLATSSFEVHAYPVGDADPKAIEIPSTVSSLGDLNLSSLALRMAFVGQF